jgi:hypothetical protein
MASFEGTLIKDGVVIAEEVTGFIASYFDGSPGFYGCFWVDSSLASQIGLTSPDLVLDTGEGFSIRIDITRMDVTTNRSLDVNFRSNGKPITGSQP